MATRLKTVNWSFPVLASLTNNTLTNLPQTTIFLPENAKSFKSVKALLTCADIVTATGGSITTKTVNLRLGAAAYTSIANANVLTNSGENLALAWEQDFTSHFVTNWAGTSMTCDFQVQLNQSTGTTLGMVNVCVTLKITYEYDDTSTTHIKTVTIPLNAPTGSLTAAAVTYSTIDALTTYLPEASKVFRNIHLVVQGNTNYNGNVTDRTITLNIGAATITTGVWKAALASDFFYRYVWDVTSSYPDTSVAQNFQMFASAAGFFNHPQAYLVVTYEFDPAATTRVMNSVKLPMEIASPMGSAAADYQRATRELFIQEPGAIVTNKIAFYVFWQQINAQAGLNMRVGTGAFNAYTDIANVVCGSNAAMSRNDTAFTLARGRNSLNFDCYRTSTTILGWNACGFWLINYTSDKATQGVGAHNNTVSLGVTSFGTAASAAVVKAAYLPSIPEPNYYITAIGNEFLAMPSGANNPTGFTIRVERLAAEGGIEWDSIYQDSCQTDPEVGMYHVYSQAKDVFKRWPNDLDTNRIPLETSRRWEIVVPSNAALATMWYSLDLLITYHSITYTVAGNITNSAGGTVDINVCRANTGEKILNTSRVGNGAYAVTWYDNTENLYVEARESSTLLGRSDNGVAA